MSIGCYKCVKTAQTTTTTVTWIFFSSRHKCRKRNKLILHKESNPKTLNSALKVYHWGTETLSWSKRQQKQQFVNQCSPLRIFNSLQAGRKCFANHATITEQRPVKWWVFFFNVQPNNVLDTFMILSLFHVSALQVRIINDRLQQLNRAFINNKGLSYRPFLRWAEDPSSHCTTITWYWLLK